MSYNEKRREYEQISLEYVVDMFKSTGNIKLINFIKEDQPDFDYKKDKEEIENLRKKMNSKNSELSELRAPRKKNSQNNSTKSGTLQNVDPQREESLKGEINSLRTEIQTKQETFNGKYLYNKYARELSFSNDDLTTRIKEKDSILSEKLIYLLDNKKNDENDENDLKDSLIYEKNEALNIKPFKCGDYSVEILSKNNISIALVLGALIPCCLSLNESGNKYLLAALFDPNTSITLVKNKEGKVIATALTVYNCKTNTIYLVHIDVARGANINGETLREVLSEYIKFIIINKPGRSVLVLPGEQTLPNLGYDVKELEEYLRSFIKTNKPELLSSIKQIDTSIKKGQRTGSKVPNLTYVLENLSLFDDSVRNHILKYVEDISNSTVYFSDPKHFLFSDSQEDKFHIADNLGGHSISNIAIDLKQQVLNIKASEELTNNFDESPVLNIAKAYEELTNNLDKNSVSDITQTYKDLDDNFSGLSVQNAIQTND